MKKIAPSCSAGMNNGLLRGAFYFLVHDLALLAHLNWIVWRDYVAVEKNHDAFPGVLVKGTDALEHQICLK